MEATNRILLVCNRAGSASCSAQFLEKCNLECATAGTLEDARTMLRNGQFDFVLAEPELPDGNSMALKDSLHGTCTSLYVAFPVRDGCWWLPVIAAGSDCVGQPALRPGEMVAMLMQESPAKVAPKSAGKATHTIAAAGGK